MTTPKQEIVTAIIDRVHALLQANGHFYPIAFIAWPGEEPQEVRAEASTPNVTAAQYLADLERAVRRLADGASTPLGLVAVALSVTHTDLNTGDARDAVEVRVEGPLCEPPLRIFAGHSAAPDGSVSIHDLVATDWEPRILVLQRGARLTPLPRSGVQPARLTRPLVFVFPLFSPARSKREVLILELRGLPQRLDQRIADADDLPLLSSGQPPTFPNPTDRAPRHPASSR